jgi:hypothetical protein
MILSFLARFIQIQRCYPAKLVPLLIPLSLPQVFVPWNLVQALSSNQMGSTALSLNQTGSFPIERLPQRLELQGLDQSCRLKLIKHQQE